MPVSAVQNGFSAFVALGALRVGVQLAPSGGHSGGAPGQVIDVACLGRSGISTQHQNSSSQMPAGKLANCTPADKTNFIYRPAKQGAESVSLVSQPRAQGRLIDLFA